MSKKIDLTRLVDILEFSYGRGKTLGELAAEFGCVERTVQRRLNDIRVERLNVKLVEAFAQDGRKLYSCVRLVPFENESVRQDQVVLVGQLRLGAEALRAFGMTDVANALETYGQGLMRYMARPTRINCEKALDRLMQRQYLAGKYQHASANTNVGIAKRLHLAIMADVPVTIHLCGGARVTGKVEKVMHRTDQQPSLLLRCEQSEREVGFWDVIDVKGIEDLLAR